MCVVSLCVCVYVHMWVGAHSYLFVKVKGGIGSLRDILQGFTQHLADCVGARIGTVILMIVQLAPLNAQSSLQSPNFFQWKTNLTCEYFSLDLSNFLQISNTFSVYSKHGKN